jgi:hypothetical protein
MGEQQDSSHKIPDHCNHRRNHRERYLPACVSNGASYLASSPCSCDTSCAIRRRGAPYVFDLAPIEPHNMSGRSQMRPARKVLLGIIAAAWALTAGDLAAQDAPILDRVMQSDTLRVGMSGNQPPFNFRNRSGTMAGMDYELATLYWRGRWESSCVYSRCRSANCVRRSRRARSMP